jgi:hypothetical protein
MMTNGLYKTALTTRLKTLEEAEGVSYGVMVLHNGRMFGGGPFFYTVGSYTCFGSGRWKGEMIGQEHTPAQMGHFRKSGFVTARSALPP